MRRIRWDLADMDYADLSILRAAKRPGSTTSSVIVTSTRRLSSSERPSFSRVEKPAMRCHFS